MKVRFRVEIELHYTDERFAEVVEKSIEPDNIEMEELKVTTYRSGRILKSVILCDRRVESLIHTVDDLLSSTSLCEKVVEKMK
ncbi:MAG: KEOPS complex subunit Pcc1 [Candidatus Asgardarchaeia archaeon]